MGRHAKTEAILTRAVEILDGTHPMTVRQVFYQLVSCHAIENAPASYNAVINVLRDARLNGEVPWEWIEDRLRRPRSVGMWSGLGDFVATARAAYRRDVWATQPAYVEVWLEKDALSGVFEDLLAAYGVTLNVGRGYDGWSSLKSAADRYEGWSHVTVLYFGDFDPSGEDMVRSLEARLATLGATPQIIKCALTRDDIDRYQLPPAFTKRTDTRRARFVSLHGDLAVELDAMPPSLLRDRLETEIRGRMDLGALTRIREVEEQERGLLRW
ncbi:MAG: hypothetical protein HYY01_00665 [Chloroflexi bacterium]|nr:hypothetical protein [Chloroflexota bacterium]